MAKKRFRKPKIGDTVFIIGETKYRAWYYKENVLVNGKTLAHCITSVPKLDGSHDDLEENFPISVLTLEPPPTPTLMFIG